MENPCELIAVMRMGPANTYYHLKPVAMARQVDHLHIVRPLPPVLSGTIENSSYHEIQGRNIVSRLMKTLRKSLSLAMRPQVKGLVSFNSFPYGLIALLAGTCAGKPVHIGFVGNDWYGHGRAWYGGMLDRLFRRASLITVTGPKMKDEMVEKDYRPESIVHLPHAIDLERFPDRDPRDRTYDCIFVGNLIPRKQVDVIISAIHRVREKKPGIRLMIVGDGPLRNDLEKLTASSGLARNITFAGYQLDAAGYFCDARMVVIASRSEGFPFALVEGMSAGAVPISTPVGTIPDMIVHGKTGLLFEVGDVAGLAENIVRLMDDRDLFQSIRREVMLKRNEFGFDYVSKLWSDWLGQKFRLA